MERTFFSGNTLEQAVLAAARHHGLDPERVAYTLRDKKHGFVNIRRRVVIEVDPAAPERDQVDAEDRQAPRREEVPAAPSGGPGHARDDRFQRERDETRRDRGSWRGEKSTWAGSGQADDEAEAVEEAIEQLGAFAGIEIESSVQREGKGFEIDLSGPDTGVFRENQGGGLDSVEHLLPRLIRGLQGHGLPCRVDSAGFREVREEELRQLARVAAEEVSRERVEKRLEPMNPADRRQVHMALVDEPGVRTESEGEGFLKRVRILPA